MIILIISNSSSIMMWTRFQEESVTEAAVEAGAIATASIELIRGGEDADDAIFVVVACAAAAVVVVVVVGHW